MSQYIGALDQGTTSTRFILFDHSGEIVSSSQKEHSQIYPKPGWVEHNPKEIWQNCCLVIEETLTKSGIKAGDIAAMGITNQRETTLAWNPKTGEPWCNAIVWQDTRTQDVMERLKDDNREEEFRRITGLPLASYFSASKIQWMLNHVPGLREAAHRGEVCFGTVDSFILWNLSGGTEGGLFLTDVTNASRTLLMDLHTLHWDPHCLETFEIPVETLPRILQSIPGEPYGFSTPNGPFKGKVALAGILGDQQAALFGQACFHKGDCKNTYGTGAFLLMNTGQQSVVSSKGLITTVAYQQQGEKPFYALEGSVAVAGSLVQWFRDNLGIIKESHEIDSLAASVEDNGGVYFVPAFSGLFAPHWKPRARGALLGLTGYATAAHIARSVLESTAFQSLDIFDAMSLDSGISLKELRVDGGMTVSELLMQFQADLLNVPVIRPKIRETTALGAAYAAGLSVGFWKDQQELALQWKEDCRWTPAMEPDCRKEHLRLWQKALKRTLNWKE
ncbi:MAG: glycerol kinase GlpK [Spirochaetaceae bacterium]|nr:glycerol kinase GlpK [Spirochaetaceae bacterium]